MSSSQASPLPSLSVSLWSGFSTRRQLSQASPWLSLSLFLWSKLAFNQQLSWNTEAPFTAPQIFAFEFLIWIAVNVGILPTQVSVTGPANSTLRRQRGTSDSVDVEVSECVGGKCRNPTRQWTEPSLSGIHWALASHGLVRLLPQLIAGLQPFTWSPVKPVLQLPQW
ncbi:hypothetical protein EYF80_046506 [Liparis tanakae]|uniref:Uncharacterized protein n=1 Tax=Liparis tanakae TaxID=230148 RepID=A0A4Z2FPX4_9TELE|nr:hypothetical protein EYF80_046506 [Liparis tanakae]